MSLHKLTNQQHQKLWSYVEEITRVEQLIAQHREAIADIKVAAKDELGIDLKTLKLCVDVLAGRIDLESLGHLADEVSESLERIGADQTC